MISVSSGKCRSTTLATAWASKSSFLATRSGSSEPMMPPTAHSNSSASPASGTARCILRWSLEILGDSSEDSKKHNSPTAQRIRQVLPWSPLVTLGHPWSPLESTESYNIHCIKRPGHTWPVWPDSLKDLTSPSWIQLREFFRHAETGSWWRCKGWVAALRKELKRTMAKPWRPNISDHQPGSPRIWTSLRTLWQVCEGNDAT